MKKIVEDFSQISSSFEALVGGPFRMKLNEIQDQSEDPDWVAKNTGTNKQPALIFVSEVVEGDRTSSQFYDYIYLKTKEGKKNKHGLGQVKAYAEAILGKEAANSTEGFDLDALPGNTFDMFFTEETYMDNKVQPPVQKKKSVVQKILPVG